MRCLSFIEGLLIALAASIIGGLLLFGFAPWFGGPFLFKSIVSGIAFGYVTYLLIRAPRRTAWTTALTAWLVAATLGWLLGTTVPGFIGLHLILIWLIRSLYFYQSPIAALIDLALCGLSLAAAAWALHHTGSVGLGIWCLFLVQALVAMIPADFRRVAGKEAGLPAGSDGFDRAFRSAEWALRKLFLTE